MKGTDADFLATSYTGTVSVTVDTGPATVPVQFDFATSGAINGSLFR